MQTAFCWANALEKPPATPSVLVVAVYFVEGIAIMLATVQG